MAKQEQPVPITENRDSVPKASTDNWGSLSMLLTPAVVSVHEEKCSWRLGSSPGGPAQDRAKGEQIWPVERPSDPMLKSVLASPEALHWVPR